jgi:outer membrane autotransporter protein
MALLASTALCAAGLPRNALAADAAWTGTTDSNYNNSANWTPTGPPDGVATFDTGGSITPTITADSTVAQWTFNPNNVSWTFTNTALNLIFSGGGISIGAGSRTVTLNNNNSPGAAAIYFTNSASAGSAIINNSPNSFLIFQNSSTAANATITSGDDSFVFFEDTASGGSARFIINSDGGPYAGFGPGQFNISELTSAGTTAGSIEGSGTFILGSKNLTAGSLNTSTEVSGTIEDGLGFGVGGSLTKVGTGTLTLSGDNAYTGGTTISAGAIQIGNGGTSGSIGDVVDNALLIFNRSDAWTYGGLISGTGAVQMDGTGTLALTNTNTYGGGTTINGGLINFNSDGNFGSGNITLNGGGLQWATGNTFDISSRLNAFAAGGATFDTNSNDVTLASTLSGVGGLTKAGAGTLTLSGTNSYSGGTTINAGTLVASADANLGNANGGLTFNGGTLQFGAGFSLADTRTITLNAGGGTFDTNGFDTAAVASAIDGTGGLTKIGPGTLALTNTNTYSGGTTINSGLINFNSGGNFGSGNITLNGGGLQWATGNTFDISSRLNAFGAGGATFDTNSNDVTLASNLSGAGSLTKAGAGTLTLTGTNTYTGATNVNGGTLAVTAATAGANLGNGGAVTFDGGTLQFINPTTNFSPVSLTQGIAVNAGGGTVAFSGPTPQTQTQAIFNGGLSGSGNLAVTGPGGTLTVIGPLAFTGGITVKDGAFLQLTSPSPAMLTGPVEIITPAAPGPFFSTAGFVNVGFAGTTVTLTETSGNFASLTLSHATFSNTTVTLNGANASLELTFGGTLGNATVINNGGQIGLQPTNSFGSANITNNGGVISAAGADLGTATIDNGAGGQLSLVTMTAAGATITNRSNAPVAFNDFNLNDIRPGGLLFQDGTADNVTITNKAGAAALFSAISSFTSAGNANITNEAGANLTFLGYDGAPPQIASAGNATINNAGMLLFDTNSTTGTANITTTGTVNLNTADTTGAATVTVNSGGSLIGNGSVGDTTINAGGMLSPGHSIGTVQVNGNLTFAPGSIYQVQISGSASDKTNVTGTATINGGTVQVTPLTPISHPTTYSILNAATVNGAFDSVVVTSPLASNPQLSYTTGTDVFLTVDPGLLSFLLPANAGTNQKNVAQGIDNGILAGGTLPSGFTALFDAVADGNTAVLNQITGEAATGITTGAMQLTNSFLGLMLNPFAGAPDGNVGALGYAREFGGGSISPQAAAAYAAVTPKDLKPDADTFAHRWSVWAQGYGGTNSTKGDATSGTADTTTQTYGVVTGFDYRAAPGLLVGFALGGGGTSWNLSQGLGGGRSDAFQLGLYATKQFGNAYLAGALSYAWHDVTTNRAVTISGTDNVRANFQAQNFAGRIEGGYRFAMRALAWTPYAAVQTQLTHTPDYAESAVAGSNTFALSFNARSSTTTRFELGSWLDRLIPLSKGDAIALRGRVAFAHDDNGGLGLNAAFQTLPGSNFIVNGAAPPTNLALLSTGAEYRLSNGVSLGAKFDTELAAKSQTYAGTGTVRYTW